LIIQIPYTDRVKAESNWNREMKYSDQV
jgi:hypothetical protein